MINHFNEGVAEVEPEGSAELSRLLARQAGYVVVGIPPPMAVGQSTKVQVRIGADTAANITLNLPKVDRLDVQRIPVGNFLSVRLESGPALQVVPESPENQFLSESTFTEWWYDVSARKSGNQALRLEIGLYANRNEGAAEQFHLIHQQAVPIVVSAPHLPTALYNWQQIAQVLLSSVAAAFFALAKAATTSRPLDFRPSPPKGRGEL